MKNIAICLWFENNAEEAVNFYLSVFKNSKILNTVKNMIMTPSNQPIGSILTIDFELNGHQFIALNWWPFFKFNESVSFVIYCKDQQEIDYYYEKLSAVEESENCWWLKDKFGVSWQLVTPDVDKMMSWKNAEKIMTEILKMKRIDVNKLRELDK